ncbi:DUF1376 domain-containing protein [Faucicola boevrei]|uniref:DUF1376 domain-containing protein n=1 Tax=Faucicola boevrei TaxID=346665 RepID=UPI000367D998|nr:DUF1376 domain-containing protein [Moraxella boevrei]
MKIHFISHHFSEWDSQTKHMNRLEKSIFMDLRTLYFSNATANNGKIDATDIELLHYRLACHTEQEQQALARLLKDQFKKIGKTYRNSDWDNQIKNIIWAMKNGKYSITDSVTKSVTANYDSITQSVTDSVTQNPNSVTQNVTTLSDSDRQKQHREKIKSMVNLLKNNGITANSKMSIAQLQTLIEQNNLNSVTDSVTQNQKGVTDGRHTADENVTKSVTQNQANIITINQTQNQEREQKSEKPQNLTAHTQRNLNSITHWQAPTLDEIRRILLANDFAGVFTQEIYDQILPKFKNHFENLEITENKRLATEQSRIDRLVAWIKREKITQQPTSTDTTTTPSKPLDPSQAILCNGLLKPLFPNMNQQQSLNFLNSNREPYEGLDETYDRLMGDIDWQNFDYQAFNERFQKVVA